MGFASEHASLHRCEHCRKFVIQAKGDKVSKPREIEDYFSTFTGDTCRFADALGKGDAVLEDGSVISNHKLQSASENGCALAQMVLKKASADGKLEGQPFFLGVSMTAYPTYARSLVFGAFYLSERTRSEPPADGSEGEPQKVARPDILFTPFHENPYPPFHEHYWPMISRDQEQLCEVANLDFNLEPASEETFDLARGWLSNCFANHESCSKPDLEYRPRRVIGIDYSDGHYRLKLTHLPSEGPAPPYAALSSAQSTEEGLRLDSINVLELSETIELDILPRKIKDGVITAQKLELAYLWVSQLCILQDDEVERRAHIAELDRIYENATVTISATRAETAEDGFLHRRELVYPNPSAQFFEIQLSTGEGATGSMVLIPHARLSGGGPGYSSAWAYAESLFSRRILSYGPLQTTWQCGSVTQANPTRFTDGFVSSVEENYIRQDHNTWGSVIESFSKHRMPVPSEKLDLLSTIAKYYLKFHEADDSQPPDYLAGLWRSDIRESLLWTRSDNAREPVQYPHPPIAPSWSWVAPNAAVKLSRLAPHALDESFTVVNYYVDPVHDDMSWGLVTSGTLTLRGLTSEATWYHRHRNCSPFSNTVVFGDGTGVLDPETTPYIQFYSDYTPEEFVVECPEGPYLDPDVGVPILLLLVSRGISSTRREFSGLGLREAEDGRWRRVGKFYMEPATEKYEFALERFRRGSVRDITII